MSGGRDELRQQIAEAIRDMDIDPLGPELGGYRLSAEDATSIAEAVINAAAAYFSPPF
jgi:hypothetical protein